MKNFIQPGTALYVTAPVGGFVSGGAYLIGGIFGIAGADTAAGDVGVLYVSGVFAIAKTSAQAWVQGDLVYWDAGTKLVTNVATGNKRVGVATDIAANPSATGNVRLDELVGSIANPVAGLGAGYKIARGSAAALDGTNPTPIATGLATITAAFVQLRGTAAPGDNTSVLTTDYTGTDGTLNVYGWKNTGGTDPTLVASTGTETFDWFAIGT